MTSNTTLTFKKSQLDSVLSTLTSNSYVTISRYTGWANTPPSFTGSKDETDAIWAEMVYGKKITVSDVSYVIDNRPWTSGETYDSYSSDSSPESSKVHVVTDDRKVYKCIFNNGVNSTSKPTSTSNSTFTTADGYVWKYMFTVSELNVSKFGSDDYTPVEVNTSIQAAAIGGTIDAVIVVDSGNNWVAHDSGTITEKLSNTQFKISSAAVTTNGYYEGSGFYVSSGSGFGFYSSVSTYVSNSSGNFVMVSTAANTVDFGSTYVISPRVIVDGDGSGVVAYSVVNSTSATVSSINVTNVGSGYTWANVRLVAAGSYSNSDYVVTPVVSPYRGHGYDPVTELGCDTVVVSVQLSNTDLVPSGFQFSTASVLKTPKTWGNASSTYTDTEFSQFFSANVTLGVSILAAPNSLELITGSTSGATATVIAANSTFVRFGDVRGTFLEGETASSNVTSSSFSLDAINTPDIEPQEGDIMMSSNFQPVTRTTVSTEKIKFTITA